MKYEERLQIVMTRRQKNALRRYAEGLGTSMGSYVRTLLRSQIPAEFWDAEEPPHPDQMTLEDSQ